MIIPYVMRKCTKCGEWLVASSVNFNKNKSCKYGLNSQCKECNKKHSKKYYEENKESIAKQQKEYREENKEVRAEYHKKYYEKNKESIVEQKKKYRETHRETIVERDIMDIPYGMKKCTKCGRLLVASSENFHKNKSGKYGLREICKECVKKRDKKYRKTHRKTIVERDNMDGMKKCTKCGRWLVASSENFYKNKKSKDGLVSQCKECKKKYDKEHNKKYRQTPQGQVVYFNIANKRRAREQNQGSGITKEQWLEMMNFFEFRCAYSGKVLTKETRSVDHIDPLNDGGANEIWNFVPMDRSLNISKKDKEMLDWYIKQPFCSAERLLKIYKWQEYAFNKWGIDTEAQ